MEFRVLGELAVSRQGVPLTVPAGKLQVLLATLLLRSNQTVPTDLLIDRLWDGAPRRARGTVPTYVMRLRQALGDDTRSPTLILTRPGGYLIQIHPDQLDLLRFRDLVRRAEVAPADAAATLRAALSLWREPVLAGLASEALRRDELPPLVEERLRVLERRIDLDLQLGHRDDLAGELSLLVKEHPMRERFWGQLMLALMRSGRRAEALERYRDVRDLLVDELGIEPGPELRHLQEAILRGEPEPSTPDQKSPVWTIPRQLPADLASFTGRLAELSALDSEPAVSAIHGPAGVGKTALAVHWSHRASHRFPDGQLYLNLRGFDQDRPPVDPGEALRGFLRALGVEPVAIPHDVEERSALFRSVVAGRRMLVLLDNAASADQVRPLLPGTAGCLVLVTSRTRLTGLVAVDDARALDLDVLSPTESVALLENLLGRDRVAAEPGAVAELALGCGHLPLALRVAAGKLITRPGQTIAEAVTELRDGGGLGALEVEGDRRAAVRAAFDMSYLALKPDEQRVFRRLGLVPGPDLTVSAAAALTDLSEEDTTRLLDRLLVMHLVDCPVPDRFRLHDLLRLYAKDRCTTDESSVDSLDALRRLFDWYLDTTRAAVLLVHPGSQLLCDSPENTEPFTDRAQAWSWLEAERTNLTSAIDDAAARDLPATVLALIDAVHGFFIARAYLDDDWRAATRTGLLAADRLDDDRARAAMHLNIAIAHFAMADLRGFLAHSAQALDHAQQANWTRAEAKALTYVGQGNHELGNPREALEFLTPARELTSTAELRADLSYVALIIAYTHMELGNLAEALAHFTETLTIGRELDSLPDQSLAHFGLGQIYTHLGDLANASANYAAGLAVSRELGNSDREAANLGGLADLAQRAGRQEEARELLRHALALSTMATYRHTEVDVLIVAGRIHTALGETQTAVAHFQHALRIARTVGYRYFEADALLGLAAVESHVDGAGGESFAAQARAIAEECGYQLLAERARRLTDGC